MSFIHYLTGNLDWVVYLGKIMEKVANIKPNPRDCGECKHGIC